METLYYNSATGEFGLTWWNLKMRYPNVSIPQQFEEFEGWTPYRSTTRPAATVTEDFVEATPVGGEQQWVAVLVSEEEAENRRRARIPTVVSMRQARLALLGAGLLDDIEAVIAQQSAAAQIEWEYAQTVERTHPLVQSLGLSEAQLDELFLQAASL